MESVLDVAEEDGVEVGPEQLVDDRLEVVQGADRFEGLDVVGAVDAAGGGECEGGGDDLERDLGVEEV